MLDLTVIAYGKIKEKAYQKMVEEYLKRLKPLARLRYIELETISHTDKNQEAVKKLEGEKLNNYLEKYLNNNSEAVVYLLAERGQKFNSIDFANWLNKKQPLILVVGGALGFSDDLYNSYPSLSLSDLTYPHELARLILLEQIYRASTILNNKSYHY
ncbi:MAG: 23S rRNA (pseudouridine(1915)-N(3))-methyltransferase RlmH [Patescibacteria group bacterium]